MALHGVPMAENDPAVTTTPAFVQSFVDNNADAFGVVGADLVLQGEVDVGGKFTVFTYSQRIEGLPVHGAVVKIPVLMGATERIGHVGIRLVPHPATPLAPDLVTASQAVSVVSASPLYTGVDTFTQPELVIYEDDRRVLHRVWRFMGAGTTEAYRFFVHSNKGDIVGVDNLIYNGDVAGLAEGYSTPCCAADNPTNPNSCPVLQPLEGMFVTTSTQLVESVGANGFYRFQGLPDGVPVNISASLASDWVIVENSAGPILFEQQSATPPTNVADFTFNPTDPTCSPWADEFATAQVNAFIGVNKTHAWFNQYFGNYAPVDRPIIAIANVNDTCNAFYNPLSQLVGFYRAGNGCNNAAFSTIISHEYGHFLVDMIVPTPSRPFHEGAADTVMGLTWDTPFIGIDLHSDGQPGRDLTFNARLNDCGSLPNWCSNCLAPHCRGLPMAGAFWDLRERIGLNQTSDLFVDFLFVTIGQVAQSVLSEVLAVDDDDGDLSNLSPNYQAIIDSFVTDHGWEDPQCGQGTVTVEWVGVAGQPQEGLDYDVDNSVCPPDVILKRTEVGGIPIDRWRVGRTVNGQPALLGTVTAAWVGAIDGIKVELGTTPGTSVQSVNTIDIPAQSSSLWSSVRVELPGHIHERVHATPVQSDPSQGNGGLLSGTVAGVARGIDVGGIGQGESQPGTFTVESWIDGMTIGTIPPGSTLTTLMFAGPGQNFITGGIDGELILQGDIDRPVPFEILGNSSGTLRILSDLDQVFRVELNFGGFMAGLIDAPGTWTAVYPSIAGDMSGTIITGDISESEIDIGGDMTGMITSNGRQPPVIVDGVFDGDVCGSQSFIPSAFPDGYGPNASKCGVSLCSEIAPAPGADPSGDPKNRYLSFAREVIRRRTWPFGSSSLIAPVRTTAKGIGGM